MPIGPQASANESALKLPCVVCLPCDERTTDGQTDGRWRASRHYASFAMFSQAPQRALCCEMSPTSFGRRLAVNTSSGRSPVVSSGHSLVVSLGHVTRWRHASMSPWHASSPVHCLSVCLSLAAISSSSRISSARTMDVSPRYWVNELHGRLTLTSRHHSTQSTNRQTDRQTDFLYHDPRHVMPLSTTPFTQPLS